jgi:hypothetical protein
MVLSHPLFLWVGMFLQKQLFEFNKLWFDVSKRCSDHPADICTVKNKYRWKRKYGTLLVHPKA